VAAFLAPLPIERMWGIGPKTAPRMRALGLQTIGDLARADDRALVEVLGSWGEHVARLARGLDDRQVDATYAARSIGAEETYEQDLRGAEAVARTLLDHASRVARRLMRAGACAHTVTIKVKYSDFTARSRRVTLAEPVQDTDAIHRAAVELLSRMPLADRRIRLTGVSVSGIVAGPPPRTLLPDAQADKLRKVEQVATRIAERYKNEGAVTRASLLELAPSGPKMRRS
jgi:DNA polymerase-4